MNNRRQYRPQTMRVLELRKNHPEWPLMKIGEEVGISRQRVHQVLKRDGFPTSSRTHSDNKGNSNTGYTSKRQTITGRGSERRSTGKDYNPRFTKLPIEEAIAMKKPRAKPKVLDEYKKYIILVGPNEAGRFTVADDREGQMLRTSIKRSAEALGWDVKVKKVRNEILFWHEDGSSQS